MYQVYPTIVPNSIVSLWGSGGPGVVVCHCSRVSRVLVHKGAGVTGTPSE